MEPEKYEPRLLHVKGTFKTSISWLFEHIVTFDSVSCIQVPLSHTSLNSGDVFILDCGLMLYQWNGSKSSGAEKNKVLTLLLCLCACAARLKGCLVSFQQNKGIHVGRKRAHLSSYTLTL